VKVEQPPADPKEPGYETNEKGDPERLPIEEREVRPSDLMRLAQVLRDV
jgi:hypothetical protein